MTTYERWQWEDLAERARHLLRCIDHIYEPDPDGERGRSVLHCSGRREGYVGDLCTLRQFRRACRLRQHDYSIEAAEQAPLPEDAGPHRDLCGVRVWWTEENLAKTKADLQALMADPDRLRELAREARSC